MHHCRTLWGKTECKAHTELQKLLKEEDRRNHGSKCKAEGCKRLVLASCVFSMCSKHCKAERIRLKKECEPHEVRDKTMARKKADEEAYLNAGVVQANARAVRKDFVFKHAEKGFTGYNQTVVIWCLKDFLRQTKFHKDLFDAQEKQSRLKAKAKARGRDDDGALGASDPRPIKRSKQYYVRRFERVKRGWDRERSAQPTRSVIEAVKGE